MDEHTDRRSMRQPERLAAPRSLVALAFVVMAAVLLVSVSPEPSHAGAGQRPTPGATGAQTSTGGRVAATDVIVSGNGLRGRAGPRRANIPVTCWWQPSLGPHDNADAMHAAYRSGALESETRARYGAANWAVISPRYPAIANLESDFAEAAAGEAQRPPQDVTWYMAVCRDDALPQDYLRFLGWNTGRARHIASSIGIRYEAYPVGEQPPARVAPIDLALYAQQELSLPTPVADRNPKVVKAGGASLVGIPTWFWVTDPAAAGAPSGTRWVRVQAGNVWAQVTATTTGVTIASVAGQTRCSPRQAATPYRAGTAESSACTLRFERASVGHPAGWPVTVTANWRLAWVGSGDTGADLGVQPHTWTTNVPVAEVQTIDTGGG